MQSKLQRADEIVAPIDMAVVADALISSFRAMTLMNGCQVRVAGTYGTVRLEEQMLRSHEALLALGVDSNTLR